VRASIKFWKSNQSKAPPPLLAAQINKLEARLGCFLLPLEDVLQL